MSIEKWSENILLADLQDDPAFTDDLTALVDQLGQQNDQDVVLNFGGVHYLNSSNLARLLKLRKMLVSTKRRLVLCNIDTTVWGVFLVTGLDKVFDFTDDLATALTGVQLDSVPRVAQGS